VGEGIDPAEEKRAQRSDVLSGSLSSDAFAALVEEYLVRLQKNTAPSTYREAKRILEGQGITASDSKESQKQFARKPQRRRPIPAKTITWKGSITHLVQRLGNTSRAINYGDGK
jgi:hypothetical protein